MSAICNYSHPELQITTDMARHPSGTLFPYNPEFYDKASSLYGPGAIYCWLLLLVSVILSWVFHDRISDDKAGPGMSNDLWAVLAYPAFAATDALVEAMKLRGIEHRALAYFCLRFPEVELNGFDEFNHTQLDLRDKVPPEILSLGQRTIDLTGPASVCYLFLPLFFTTVGIISYADHKRLQKRPERIESPALEEQTESPDTSPSACSNSDHILRKGPRVSSTLWAFALAWATWGYVTVMLTICTLSLGDYSIIFFIFSYEGFKPLYLMCVLFTSLLFGAGFLFFGIHFVRSCQQREWQKSWELLQALGICLLVGCFFPGGFYMSLYWQPMSVAPDLGIAVTERDQLATLIVGIATLGYTIYSICYPGRREVAVEEEMEPLQAADSNA